MVRDRSAERFALEGVARRHVERGAAEADRHGRDPDPSGVEHPHDVAEGGASRAEEPVAGHAHPLEGEGGGVGALEAELLLGQAA